jgi:N-sulfoglucosamine sulfohydrolase
MVRIYTCTIVAIVTMLMPWQASAKEASSRPNILLFTADDLHAESLRTYGSMSDMTPNLDRFAKSGLVFNRAHVNAAICSPSRKIIATGLYGHNSGAMGFRLARKGTPHLINTLHAAGYLTGVIDKVPHSTPHSDTQWDFIKGKNAAETAHGRSPSLFYKHTKAFLEQSKTDNKPFYLMVNSRDPHRPYCSPDNLGHPKAEAPSKFYTPEEVEIPGFLPDLPMVRSELASYQNSVHRMDDTFGRTMQALNESGLAGNTLVIFISDNGQATPFAKANTWYHASRTPMLVRLPGVVKPGRRDDTHFVSVVDFLPTFLEFTGVKGPAKLDGRSFLPLLKGETQTGRDFVFTQIDSLASGAAYPMRCIQSKSKAYIYNPFSNGTRFYKNANEGKTMQAMKTAAATDPAIAARIELFRHRVPEEFYDTVKDPNCLNNLIDDPEYKSEISAMKTTLEAWMVTATDPMLEAFQDLSNRETTEKVIAATYGSPKAKHAKKKKSKN